MQYPNLEEQTIRRNVVFEGKILTLRHDDALLPNGRPCKREVVDHPGGVCVAALTEADELLLVRQFRYPYGQVLLELPAGKLEPGEDPLLAGQRELEEETGAIAARFDSLGLFYPSPGYCGEKIYIYHATDLRFTRQRLDEDEFLLCERIPLARAGDLVMQGEIVDGKTQTAILKLLLMRK